MRLNTKSNEKIYKKTRKDIFISSSKRNSNLLINPLLFILALIIIRVLIAIII